MRAAHYTQILDDSILADQGLKNYRALHFHLAGKQRVVGTDGTGDDGGSVGGHLHMLGGVGGDIGGGSGVAGGRGFRSGLRNRARLQIQAHRTAAGTDDAMGVAGNYFDFQWRQGGPVVVAAMGGVAGAAAALVLAGVVLAEAWIAL